MAEKSRQVGPVEAQSVPWDALCNDSFGPSHGQVEGAPVTNDSLSGGSVKVTEKGDFGPSKNGVGLKM